MVSASFFGIRKFIENYIIPSGLLVSVLFLFLVVSEFACKTKSIPQSTIKSIVKNVKNMVQPYSLGEAIHQRVVTRALVREATRRPRVTLKKLETFTA